MQMLQLTRRDSRNAFTVFWGTLLFGLLTALLPAGCNDDGDEPPTSSKGNHGGSHGGTSSDTEAQSGQSGQDGGTCGCDSGAGAPSGGESTQGGRDDSGSAPTQAGTGVSIDVSLDEALSASADVPTTGGSVTATGADGTTYELIIPEGALLEPTTVTVTPVSEAGALPATDIGKSHMGAQLGPDGLALFKPATLLITPGDGADIPLEQQLFVQWRGDGTNVALAAPDPNSEDIRLAVLHFSGAAVYTKGADAPIAPVRAALSSDPQASYDSAVGEYTTRARSGESATATASLEASLTAGELFRQFEDKVVKPVFAEAESSCSAGELAITVGVVYGWFREMSGLGKASADPWTKKAAELYPKVAELCMKEAYEKCRDEHVVHEILPKRLALREGSFVLTGELESNAPVLDGYVKSCLRFELDLESAVGFVSHSSKCSFSMSQSVKSRDLELALGGSVDDWYKGNTPFTGNAPIESEDYDAAASCASGKNCGKLLNFTDAVSSLLYVMSLKLDLGSRTVNDFELVYRPSPDLGSSFQIQDTCSDPTYTSPSLMANWWTTYVVVQNDENPLDQTKGGYVLDQWAVTEGKETIATKHLSGATTDDSGTEYSAVDVFTLRHAPQ